MLIDSDWKTNVHRKVGEKLSPKCIKASVKFGGGSVMVWGMISGDGVGPLMRLHAKVNVAVYKQLVKDHVLIDCAEEIQPNNHPYSCRTMPHVIRLRK